MPGRTRPIEKFAAAVAKCSAEVSIWSRLAQVNRSASVLLPALRPFHLVLISSPTTSSFDEKVEGLSSI